MQWEEKGSKELAKKIGCSSVALEARDDKVRQQETNTGNFVSDAVRSMHRLACSKVVGKVIAYSVFLVRTFSRSMRRTDVALINGGTIRGNKVGRVVGH